MKERAVLVQLLHKVRFFLRSIFRIEKVQIKYISFTGYYYAVFIFNKMFESKEYLS